MLERHLWMPNSWANYILYLLERERAGVPPNCTTRSLQQLLLRIRIRAALPTREAVPRDARARAYAIQRKRE